MGVSNSNLHKAKQAKNDEFYTQLSDVSEELRHYKKHFKDKIILCNCDDPTFSAFWIYFHLNFKELGLKKLISTHYDRENPTYKMEYEGGDDNNAEVGIKTPLQGNGDFRNEECIELLKEADIVCSNPPFSLFSVYLNQIFEYKKDFLIIGNRNSLGKEEIIKLIKDNKMWVGYSSTHHMFFKVPDWYAQQLKNDPLRKAGHGQSYIVNEYGETLAEVNALWFTNLDIKKRYEKIILWKDFDPKTNEIYENYPAFNVNKVGEIPKNDYFELIVDEKTFKRLKNEYKEKCEVLEEINDEI